VTSAKRGKRDTARRNRRIAHEAEGLASGALAGAVVGAAAGPPGMVAGAVIGAVAGALTGAAMDDESFREDDRERDLDAQIGVSGGDLGAPNLAHPPEKSGAGSATSAAVKPAPAAPEK
jgi:phage tail tape-measure protein